MKHITVIQDGAKYTAYLSQYPKIKVTESTYEEALTELIARNYKYLEIEILDLTGETRL